MLTYITKAIELVCQTAFRKCTPSVPLPSSPCKSKCLTVMEACGPYLEQSLIPSVIPGCYAVS